MQYLMASKTKNNYLIEKSVPQDHRLSSVRKPRDEPIGRIFLSHPHTHDRLLKSSLLAQAVILDLSPTRAVHACMFKNDKPYTK